MAIFQAVSPVRIGLVPAIAAAVNATRQTGGVILLSWDNQKIIKCALTAKDVTRYNLPTDMTKFTDTRRDAFVAKYGDVAVELDALPVDVLRDKLVTEVESRTDMAALAETRKTEQAEIAKLGKLLGGVDE